MGNTVEGYIKRQNSPQKEICARLRRLILKTFPGIKEEMKMGVPWYEGRYYIVALKDHVNIGFSIQGLSKEELSLFEGAGKLMRHTKLFSEDELDEGRIAKLLKLARKSKCSCPPK